MTQRRYSHSHIDFIRCDLMVCVILTLTILTVYWQVRDHAFLNFDDPTYVSENAYVKKGLTPEGFRWAFSFSDKDNTYWHPLTWLSYMLDIQLHGMNAGRHLLTNVFLHLLNSLLLFFAMRRLTGALWPSAFVAGLFALHPLNVESVAWITERKSVLSTLFWMLTLLAYYNYTTRKGLGKYLLMLSLFALGLMAKPILVTMPFVFLLLDYWPLNRLRLDNSGDGYKISPLLRLTLEKIPFFMLSAGSMYLSAVSLHSQGNFISMAEVPLDLRIGNALVSYVGYIKKMILPYNLSVYYPYPKMLSLWQPAGSLLILIVVTVVVIRNSREKPYLLVGWLWYLVTLLPVLGLVQAGLWPAMADRFVYAPMIGLFIMICWGGYEVLGGHRYQQLGLVVITAAMVSLTFVTWIHIGHWKNSKVLFEHALRVDGNNALAHNNLGVALRQQGRVVDAIVHYDAALRLKPDYPAAHHNLGLALMRVGQIDEAVGHFRQAIQLKPDDAVVEKSLHKALAAQRAINEKMVNIKDALALTPDAPELHYQLGNMYDKKGDIEKAIAQYKTALALRPDFIPALNNLAIAYAVKGEYDNALTIMQQMITLQPENAATYYSVASVLARQNKVDESIQWLKTAIRKGFKNKELMKRDKNFDSIRGSRKYQELLENF
ncbi:MAG: tetratricopeptide repeat protein [Deltaproteobacteria bacterium]|nr:MAG: tetratricopeptide repeat protein [Deltaproteobacteria bacterium]